MSYMAVTSSKAMNDATSPLTIRRSGPEDWPAVWALLRPTFAAGDTYTLDPDISEADAHRFWVEAPQSTWVACDADGSVLGTYFLKPNQPKLGAHVGNCGYVTSPAALGRGVASAMC